MKSGTNPLLTALSKFDGQKPDFTDPLFLLATKATIERGYDIDALDKKKTWSALHYLSLMPEHTVALTRLLKAGANPNVREGSGTTPLAFAVFQGNDNAVELLLEYGADPSLADDVELTPYILAGELQHPDQVPLYPSTVDSVRVAHAAFTQAKLNLTLPLSKKAQMKKGGRL